MHSKKKRSRGTFSSALFEKTSWMPSNCGRSTTAVSSFQPSPALMLLLINTGFQNNYDWNCTLQSNISGLRPRPVQQMNVRQVSGAVLQLDGPSIVKALPSMQLVTVNCHDLHDCLSFSMTKWHLTSFTVLQWPSASWQVMELIKWKPWLQRRTLRWHIRSKGQRQALALDLFVCCVKWPVLRKNAFHFSNKWK